MNTILKKRNLTVLFAAIALLLPMDGIAQKTITRKKTTTEQTAPAKKPSKRLSSKSKSVKVSEPDGYIKDHGYVDLGLPSGIKWATCNVGASSPSDYGSYFAWGETSTKSEYTSGNSKTFNRNFGDISGDLNYDAARANWGGSWRLPTKAECQELVDKCKWTWTTNGGHNGYKVTGPNGSSIFLPAAGWRYGTSLDDVGTLGSYWSSTPNEGNAAGAYRLSFSSGYHDVDWYGRNFGRGVLPVAE